MSVNTGISFETIIKHPEYWDAIFDVNEDIVKADQSEKRKAKSKQALNALRGKFK